MIFCWIIYLEMPTDMECKIIMKVAEDSEFKTLFFEQSRSAKWFKSALNSGLLDFVRHPEYPMASNSEADLKSFDIEIYCFNRSVHYLAGHADRDSMHIWDFIKTISNEDTCWKLLTSIYSWTGSEQIALLERCSTFHDFKSSEYVDILYRIAEFNPSYCFEKILHKVLLPEYFESGEDLTYQIREILKILSNKIPSKMISPLWLIIKQHLKNTQRLGADFYTTADLYNIDLKDNESLKGIQLCYSTLAASLRKSAEFSPDDINDFIEKNRYSVYEPVIWLILYAVKDRENQFKDAVYHLFEHSSVHSWLLLKSNYDVEFREIFKKAYPFFSEQQKICAQQIIEKMKLSNEIYVYQSGGRKRANLSIGLAKYSFIRSLPASDINNNPSLRKSGLELSRRFGIKNEKSRHSKIMAGVVRAPIPEDIFPKMRISDWINSFRKYNADRDPFGTDFLKGGIDEHSDAFRNFCKTEPFDFKIDILELIADDADINRSYLISGLSGLAESDCRSDRLLSSFLAILPILQQEDSHSLMIRISTALLRKKIYNDTTINLLLDAAVDFSAPRYRDRDSGNETSMRGLITQGMNHNAGIAVSALMQARISMPVKTVFDTVEKILKDGPNHLKAYVLYKLAFLNEIDKERSFNIFVNHLQKENNIYITASSIWSLQYMTGINFEKLKPVFSKLIDSPLLGQQDSIWLFSILHFSSLFNREGAEELLHELIIKNAHSRTSSIRHIAEHFYHNESSKIKSQSLLAHLLKHLRSDDKLKIHYGHLDHIKLEDIYIFLSKFIESEHFELNDSFISYLTLQCSSYPFLSIELFNESLGKMSGPKIFRKSDSIAKFTAAAFNAVKGNDAKSSAIRKKLLESFGILLRDHRYRIFSNKILDEIS